MAETAKTPRKRVSKGGYRKKRVAKMEIERKPGELKFDNIYQHIAQLIAPWLEPGVFDAMMQKLQPKEKANVLTNCFKILAMEGKAGNEGAERFTSKELEKRVFGPVLKSYTIDETGKICMLNENN